MKTHTKTKRLTEIPVTLKIQLAFLLCIVLVAGGLYGLERYNHHQFCLQQAAVDWGYPRGNGPGPKPAPDCIEYTTENKTGGNSKGGLPIEP